MASPDAAAPTQPTERPHNLGAAFAERYRIERELGAGGMATVYLAEDLRHHRRVAIKLLHAELSAMLGPDRFLKEIELTANLQHPHILPLFDSGSTAGLLYYVMPFVEGETLRARLDRERQLPIADALRIAREVADALAYAHARGVVHRDVKPENILLQDGHALVADFGIALAVQQAGGQRMTQTGLSLGTPQYMSPEQAMGEKNIDARTDIYALGAVTYEMLCGDPPFTGSSVQAIVARAMTERPASMRTVRETVPHAVEAAVVTALAKLPADRFATATEFATALTNPDIEPRSPTSASEHNAVVLGLGVAVAVLAAALALLLVRSTRAPEPFPVRSEIATPGVRQKGGVTMSPDGHTVAFIGLPNGRGNTDNDAVLYVRRLDQLIARPIPGTEGAASPVFSADGASIVYVARRQQVVRVSLDGGTPVVLAQVADDGGVSCSSRGDVVVGAGIVEGGQGLFRVNPAGGPLLALTHVNRARAELSHEWPQFLSDGRTIVFTIWYGTPERAELAATTIDDGAVTPLGILGAKAIGFVDGWLLYVRADGMAMAVRFDPRSRRVTGAPLAVQDSVYIKSGSGGQAGAFVTAAGGLVYARGESMSQLLWVDRAGHASSTLGGPRAYRFLRLSPDGRRVAITLDRGTGSDIWILDLASGALSPLTTSGSARNPVWSADGRRILYVSTQGGRAGFWWQPSDGSGGAVRAGEALHNPWYIDLSPDNRSVIFNALYDGSFNLEALSLDSAHDERDLAASPTANEAQGRFAPDGRHVAYVSNESGRQEVYVRPYPENGERLAISIGGGTHPVWSRDGSRLYYWDSTRLIVAALAARPTLHVVSRDTLFSGPFDTEFDVSLDGTRFLVIQPSEAGLGIVAVPAWRGELRRLTAAAAGAHTR